MYIEAFQHTLRSITPEHQVPTDLLLTCRGLNTEVSEYLYNYYLFNIVGKKRDCLATYESFLNTMKKHARHDVHVDAFSNGSHSSTMCISIQAGEGRMAMLKRRDRGEPKQIQELEKEVALAESEYRAAHRLFVPQFSNARRHLRLISAAFCTAVALLIAWLISI